MVIALEICFHKLVFPPHSIHVRASWKRAYLSDMWNTLFMDMQRNLSDVSLKFKEHVLIVTKNV